LIIEYTKGKAYPCHCKKKFKPGVREVQDRGDAHEFISATNLLNLPNGALYESQELDAIYHFL
jgi:hypothetical protein